MLRSLGAILLLCLGLMACTPAGAERAENSFAVVLDTSMPTTTVAHVDPVPSSSAPTSTTTTLPEDPHRTWVATARAHVERLEAFDDPSGEPVPFPFVVPNPHQFGGPLALMVVSGGPGDAWLEVQLPIRPNGSTGWVRASDYELEPTRVRATVDLATREVVVFDGGEEIARSEAVIGAEDTPTPLGTFFVAAIRENPPEEPFLGSHALVLSSYSESFESFSGGLPVIAIHGTNRPDQLGTAISFGCVRVPNEVIEFLADHVPLGAPVDVVA